MATNLHSIELKSTRVSAKISTVGAKIYALQVSDVDLLFYDLDDLKHSGIPLCLPNFGPLKDNEFVAGDGKKYAIGQHGFVRDTEFQIVSQVAEQVVLRADFTAQAPSFSIFPFVWKVVSTVKLLPTGLSLLLEIFNQDTKPLPLSPGLHPYFRVADKNAIVIKTTAQDGVLNDGKFTTVALKESGFLTPVADGYKITGAPDINLLNHSLAETIVEIGAGRKIKITATADAFNRLTIWRKTATVDYICIEPSNAGNRLNTDPLLIQPGKSRTIELTLELAAR